MRMKKNHLIILVLTIVFVVAPMFINPLIAQPPPPTPVAIPLDGGLFALLVAGLFYGGRKLYKEEKNKKTDKDK